MPREDMLSAVLRAGLVGTQRLIDTQQRFASDLWTTYVEPKEVRAWNLPSQQRSDMIRNYLVDMVMDCAVAARSLSRNLQPVAESAQGRATSHTVDGCTVMLPARIKEASQGSATYAVDPAIARDVLDKAGLPFEPVITGGDAALLSLFMVDYRKSDLGAYAEFGAAIMGHPKGDPLAPPGMVIFALPVSGEFTRDCGQQIWGYPKTLVKGLKVWREGERGYCHLPKESGGALTFSVSSRGFSQSHEIPLVTYTVKDGRPTRVIFRRSGEHERLRAGGSVKLDIGDEAGKGVGVASAQMPEMEHLCETLRRFGLPGKKPVASGWTEVMTGSFGVPEALADTAPKPPEGGEGDPPSASKAPLQKASKAPKK